MQAARLRPEALHDITRRCSTVDVGSIPFVCKRTWSGTFEYSISCDYVYTSHPSKPSVTTCCYGGSASCVLRWKSQLTLEEFKARLSHLFQAFLLSLDRRSCLWFEPFSDVAGWDVKHNMFSPYLRYSHWSVHACAGSSGRLITLWQSRLLRPKTKTSLH